MSNPAQNHRSNKIKKFSYAYMIGAVSFFAIIIFVVYYSAHTFEPEEKNHERIGWVEPEPKEIDVTNIESLRELSIGELIFHANDFSSNRLYNESIILYEIVLEKNPNDVDALNGLGYSLSRTNSLDNAIIHYTRVLDLDASNVNAHNGMGVVYADLREYDKANSFYEKSLEISKNNVNAYNGLGFTHAHTGLFEKSVKFFLQSLEIDPLRVETHNGIGFSYLQSGQIDESIRSYEQALAIDSDNLDAMLGLALASSENGQNEKASELIEKARTISSTISSETINKIILQGNILVDGGEYEKATIFYDRVLKLYDNVNAMNGKAIALIGLEKYDQAEILLDKVFEIDPDNNNAKTIKKMIQEQKN